MNKKAKKQSVVVCEGCHNKYKKKLMKTVYTKNSRGMIIVVGSVCPGCALEVEKKQQEINKTGDDVANNTTES